MILLLLPSPRYIEPCTSGSAVLIDNPELAPQGCGEPAITCVGVLIANALSDTVVRLSELSLLPERVQAGLDAVAAGGGQQA